MKDVLKGFKPKEVVYTPRDNIKMYVLANMQVSKGKYSQKNMQIIHIEITNKYYLIQYGEEFPTIRRWIDRGRSLGSDFRGEEISCDLASVLVVACKDFKEELNQSHLNPYSYLYGYVLGRSGVKLHDMWSFEV